mgnify:FL=1
MDNSLNRLIDGMVSTLRQEVIPHIDTEFARGQAFGVIYMLKSLQLRAEWSPEFIGKQLSEQLELADQAKAYLKGVEAPKLPEAAAPDASVAELQAQRDHNDQRICALIEWHGNASSALGAEKWAGLERELRTFMDKQMKHELKPSAKPIFAEISSGAD